MAEGYLRHLAGDRFEVSSAGTNPKSLNPEAVAAMREIGVDITMQRSKSVDEFYGQDFEYVITLCDHARQSCPVFHARTANLHWNLEDPAAAEGAAEVRKRIFRQVRDDIMNRIRDLVANDSTPAEEVIRLTIDKFTFLIPRDLYYCEADLWIRLEGDNARLGLSDFAQQRNGDIAFAEIRPVGTALGPGDEIGSIETVKINVSLPSPVMGTVVDVNPHLQEAAEVINQDPYGKGWLALVALTSWQKDRAALLDADAYLALVKEKAEAEMKK